MGWCWRKRKMKFARHAGLGAGLAYLSVLTAAPVLSEEASQTGVAAALRGHDRAVELTLIAGLTVFSGFVAFLYHSA